MLPISDKSLDYAGRVHAALAGAGLRATVDASNERLQAKIKIATDWKIPYLLVVGPRDAAAEAVSVRARGIREDLGALSLNDFVSAAAEEVRTRSANTVIKQHFAQRSTDPG